MSRVLYQPVNLTTPHGDTTSPRHVEEEEMVTMTPSTGRTSGRGKTAGPTSSAAASFSHPTDSRSPTSLTLPPKHHSRARSEGGMPKIFHFSVNPVHAQHGIDIHSMDHESADTTHRSMDDQNISSETAINGGPRHNGEEQQETWLQTHLKSIIYGGLDGIITTFATVTSVAGANLSVIVILVLGIAHLFADGLSMGMGDAISEASELEHAQAQRKRLMATYDRDRPSCERRLITAYLQRGIPPSHATRIVSLMSEHADLFVDALMVETLETLPEHVPHVEDEERGCCPCQLSEPLKAGLVTMFSFILFGSIPLLPYIIVNVPYFHIPLEPSSQLIIAIFTTIITLFLLGVIKSALVNEADDDTPTPTSSSHPRSCISHRTLSSLWSGFVMALNGSIAAAIGYAIGWILKEVVHIV